MRRRKKPKPQQKDTFAVECESILTELGFYRSAEVRVHTVTTSHPNPVEFIDSAGVVWQIYRHVTFPKDLQLWIHNGKSHTVRFRQLGRLLERTQDFPSLLEQPLNELIKEAEACLQQVEKLAV